MKIFRTLMAASMLATASAANAQLSWCPEVDTDSYFRFQASFLAEQLTHMGAGMDKYYDPKGFSFGALTGISVSDNLPLFVETGATVNWTHSVEDFEILDINQTKYYDYKFTHIHFDVPLNMAYKFTINDKFGFTPFVGFNFKVNAMARLKSDTKIFALPNGKSDDRLNLLSRDDMGGRDDRGKIFQLGGQIGLGFSISRVYIGWQYQGDFMRFIEQPNGDKNKFHNNYLTLGYQF